MEKLVLNVVLPIRAIFAYNIEKNDQPTAVRQRNANWIGVRACQGGEPCPRSEAGRVSKIFSTNPKRNFPDYISRLQK
ncbi:MAG: hypothetical protein LBC87_05430 [Fibromonadaceae bacterium]|nr:hypothetical protein [Fibromonadaceae bacterium]